MALMKFREPNQVKWIGSRPGHNGTKVAISGIANNAEVIIYTVPVGVVLYLTFYSFSISNSAAAAQSHFSIYTDGAVHYLYLHSLVPPAIWQDICSGTFNPPLELPAGYYFRLFASGVATTLQGSIAGWVE